jgi:hypothetical protein
MTTEELRALPDKPLTTTPYTPITGSLWTMAKNDLSWLQRHERIVIVALVLLVGGFLGNKALNYDSAMKDAKVVALTQVVAQDKQNVSNLALQASQAQAVYQTTLDATTKLNAQLSASNAQLSVAMRKNQTVDATLALPALGQRLEVLVPSAQGGVTSATSGISLNDTASRGVVSALEQVPVLTAQLANETQVAQNNDQLVTQAQALNGKLYNEIDGLNKSVVDITAQGNAEVAAEKLNTKKAFRKGLKVGIGIGVVIGGFIMHAL